MTEEQIVRFCSPTLAGLKTAGLFTCPCEDMACLLQELRRVNTTLNPRGLQALPLRCRDGKALIYVYRPARLQRDLAADDAACLLRGQGYPWQDARRCLAHLVRKLRAAPRGPEQFPHEIGLFLGYPPEDVRGFMENGAQKCKCTGCWKVYGDAESAQRLFACYRRCTALYCRLWADGARIEQLTVQEPTLAKPLCKT